MKIKKICKRCGKEFEVYPHRKKSAKYCSRKCQNPKKRIRKICLICGKEFECYPNSLKPNRRKFCSLQCRYDSQKSKYKIPRIRKICINCGKSFIFVQRQPHHKGKFCSKECRNELGVNWKGRGKRKVKCEYCNKLIIRHLWYIENSKNYFCSFKCHLNWQWENPEQIFNILKGQMFGKGYKPNELDKKAIKASILIHKIRRSLNVNK